MILSLHNAHRLPISLDTSSLQSFAAVVMPFTVGLVMKFGLISLITPLGCEVYRWVCLYQGCPLWFLSTLCCRSKKEHILHWNVSNRSWNRTLACIWKTWRTNSNNLSILKIWLSKLWPMKSWLSSQRRSSYSQHHACMAASTHAMPCVALMAKQSAKFVSLLWAWSSCSEGYCNEDSCICSVGILLIILGVVCLSRAEMLICFSLHSNLPSKEEH